MTDLDLREWAAYGNFVGVNAGDESESLFRVGDPDNAQAAAADHNALVAEVRSLRDDLAREPIRTAIEYDHWRDAAFANRNEADALAARLVEVERERDRQADLIIEFRKQNDSAGNAIQLAIRERQHETKLRLELLREFWRAVHDRQDAPDGWLISESELICAVQDMHRPGDCMADAAEARLAAVRKLHHPMRWQGREVCDECVRHTSPMPEPVTWPCPTIRALDAEVTDHE